MQFALFATGNTYEVAADQEPAYTGTTDTTGVMRILDDNGFPASLDELARMSAHWVLRETSAPTGYRGDTDVPLYFDPGITSDAMLLSADPWTTGAYAQPKLMVTTTEHGVFDVSGREITNGEGELPGGLMFAVVMQKAADGTLLRRELAYEDTYRSIAARIYVSTDLYAWDGAEETFTQTTMTEAP